MGSRQVPQQRPPLTQVSWGPVVTEREGQEGLLLLEPSISIQEAVWIELLRLLKDLGVMQDRAQQGEDLCALKDNKRESTNPPPPRPLFPSQESGVGDTPVPQT